jgi:hypothetical protein
MTSRAPPSPTVQGAYYHTSFVKGRRELCQHIKRVKIKGNGGRKPSNPETEPNFYLFPPILPSPSQESRTMNPTKIHAESAASGGNAKVESGIASLLPPGPADLSDRPLAQLLSMGGPIQNPYPYSSVPSHGCGAKQPMQDLSLLSFLSNAKNSAPQSQSGVGSTAPAQQHPSAAALSGAPYILTSTMGTSPPAPSFAPAFEAAASQSLQHSLLLQYSRRLEAEAQARERNAILAMLLNATLPALQAPAAAPSTGAGAAPGDARLRAPPATSLPSPAEPPQLSTTASSLLRLLAQMDQQQQTGRSQGAGANATSWAAQEERGGHGQ